MKKVDAIIVGQGISGSLLSAEFLKNGKTVLVIDEEKEITSSKVSAGLYNPIVFKRVVKSWMIDELLPVLHECYKYMESCCNQTFHTKRKIVKVFVNDEEKAQWLKKTEDENFNQYLGKEISEQDYNGCIKPHHGLAFVNNAGNVNVKLMIETWADYLKTKHSYIAAHFLYEDVQLVDHSVRWKDYEANHLIFCEGYSAINNPFFNNLPFVPAKGEVLTVKINDLYTAESVLNKGVFVLPEGQQLFRVGATYVWDKIDEEITSQGKEELCQKLEKLIQTSYTIIDQKAGIRPSTKDRRPVLGKHPQLPQLAMLNGMGTKAVLLAPYFAKQLFEHLFQGKNIHPEVNINRL
jgi:glycine/D-amino acid oxidase-like deaminating enzyme